MKEPTTKGIIILGLLGIICLSGIGLGLVYNKISTYEAEQITSSKDIYEIFEEKLETLSEEEVLDIWQETLFTTAGDISYEELKERGYFERKKAKAEARDLEKIKKYIE